MSYYKAVALAVVLLTSFLYKWNEKQAARRKGSKAKVLPPITSRKAELLNGQTSLTKEKFGISKEQTNCMAFRPAAYEQCSNSSSEMQDIMGRAFDDTLKTGELTTESEEEHASDVKDIENETFTRALNLYFLTTNLPEIIIVNSAVSSDHFYLMATHALFGFGSMSSHVACDSASKVENVLSSYNFTRVQVAPATYMMIGGDCLFSSVIFQLKQMVSSGNSELISHLKAIEFHTLCLRSSLLCL